MACEAMPKLSYHCRARVAANSNEKTLTHLSALHLLPCYFSDGIPKLAKVEVALEKL